MMPRDVVIPTVYVAGPPKSGSSYLWSCLLGAFSPQTVCDGEWERWSDGACDARPFLLPRICYTPSAAASCWRPVKEGRWITGSTSAAELAGPPLPLAHWSHAMREFRHACQKNGASAEPAETVHRLCMRGSPCPELPYAAPTPPHCLTTCDSCESRAPYERYEPRKNGSKGSLLTVRSDKCVIA